MKLATTIGEMYPYIATPAEAVKSYCSTGFKYLDYSFYQVITRPDSPYVCESDAAWKAEVDAAAEAAAESGFKFVQAHSPNYNPAVDCDHELGIRAVNRTIEACARLGIRNMVIHTSFGLTHLYPQDRDAYFRFNADFLAKLLPAAEKNNVTLCVENSAEGNMGNRYFFMTAEEMNDFIAFVGHPLIGACWDIGHANMRKADQYKELTSLGKNLCTVHIHDNDGVHDQHLEPFAGTVDLDSVVRALLDIKFPGYFTFEAECFLNFRLWNKSSAPLAHPTPGMKHAAITALYQIGKEILSAYNCFEE